MKDKKYYENEQYWGSYITLENVIDNIILTSGDDSYFRNIDRHILTIYAKQGLKKLNIDVGGNIKTFSIKIPASKIVPYPKYMLDWHRISVITSCGTLQELKINNTPSTIKYLQDATGKLMYDEQCNVMIDEHIDIEFDVCFEFECDENCKNTCKNEYADSWVKDKGNHFVFSDDLVDKGVVIEYTISSLTSMKESDIRISDKLELVIDNYIRYNALRAMRNVPNIVWREYYQTYKVEKRRAKSLLSKKLSLVQIVSAVSKRL